MIDGTHNNKSGLSLVEVMIALVILGTALISLLGATSRCLAVARAARDYENARHLISVTQQQFKEAQLEAETSQTYEGLEEQEEEISFDEPYERFTGGWRVEEVLTKGDTAVEEGCEGLYMITYFVNWLDREKDMGEEVVTYVYDPESAKQKAGS